jgi:hypothetical protein
MFIGSAAVIVQRHPPLRRFFGNGCWSIECAKVMGFHTVGFPLEP